ncbi:MAG: PLP-dependent transferase [Gemmatimonadetes bacterium]|nr:PLP-dependent transferase [Gemmatimonadota bacterium]
MKKPPAQGFGTRAVHAGQSPDPTTGAIMPPIYQTSTYVQPELGQHLGYEYARVQNPTREALEGNLASLEGGAHGLAFASGLSAIEAVVKTLSAGDHVVSEENTYGGTTRMFAHVLSRLGIRFSWVDTRDADRVREAFRPETRLLLVETPTNPMMRLSDIAVMAEIAHASGALLLVDNTFATPFNQRPLELGADVVAHSTTKYLNGHSDLIGGALIVRDDDLAEQIRFVRKSTGAVPGPMDAWLVLRGTKTLHLRMKTHNENGMAVARFLEGHRAPEVTYYPGLESHPQHELARRQMTGYTGMVAVELGSGKRAKHFVERTRIFQLAESLGGVESIISVPAIMTHASVPKERRDAMGVTDGLVRLSAGIEDLDDLLADLDQALEGI